MNESYSRLSKLQRHTISSLYNCKNIYGVRKYTYQEIAEIVNCHKSTISREIQRNGAKNQISISENKSKEI